MEAATPLHRLPDERVTVAGDRVLVEALELHDATLAEVVTDREQAGHAAAETVATAAEIGARVLSREALGADVDMVQRQLEKVGREVETAFAERAEAVTKTLEQSLEQVFGEGGGQLAKALESHSDELAALVTKHFAADSTTAVQHQVQERVRAIVEESNRGLIQHFSSAEGNNPLADFKQSVTRTVSDSTRRQEDAVKDVVTKLSELRLEVTRLTEQAEAKVQVAEAEQRGTAKGRSFEEQVFLAVERIAERRGDVAWSVGDEHVAGGGKRGDVVVEIEAAAGECQGRFVLEAKDSRLSKNEAWRQLDGAMEQRDATFAILVVAAEDEVPAGREALHEYEGNKLIVTYDREAPDELPLEVAYRYARLRCLMQREQSLTLDAAGVRDAAAEASSALADAQKIRKALSGATKNVEQARDALDGMVERVRDRLARIEGLIES